LRDSEKLASVFKFPYFLGIVGIANSKTIAGCGGMALATRIEFVGRGAGKDFSGIGY
jgi:hypothetical protein